MPCTMNIKMSRLLHWKTIYYSLSTQNASTSAQACSKNTPFYPTKPNSSGNKQIQSPSKL